MSEPDSETSSSENEATITTISEEELCEAQTTLDALISSDINIAWVKNNSTPTKEEQTNNASELAARVIDICRRIDTREEEHKALLKTLQRFIGTSADKKLQSKIFEPIKLLTQADGNVMFEAVSNNLVNLLTEKLVSLLNIAHQQKKRTKSKAGKGNNSHTTVSSTPTTVTPAHIFQTADTHTSEAYHKNLTEFRNMSKAVMKSLQKKEPTGNTSQNEKKDKINNRSVNPTHPCNLCMLVRIMLLYFMFCISLVWFNRAFRVMICLFGVSTLADGYHSHGGFTLVLIYGMLIMFLIAVKCH